MKKQDKHERICGCEQCKGGRALVILSDEEVKAWNEAREKEAPPKAIEAKATVPYGWGEV